MNRFCHLLAVLGVSAGCATAATTSVNSFNTDNFLYTADPMLDDLGGILAVGSNIQIGYFTTPFPVGDASFDWDSFVPLTGDGSNNLANFASNPDFTTVVGEGTDSNNAGYWNLTAAFDNAIVGQDVPTGGERIGIRIFNSSTVAGSSHYNTVTSADSGWVFPAPNDPAPTPADASIDGFPKPALDWEDNSNTFQTSITNPAFAAVPEASESVILLLGLSGLLRHRRRRS